jgi:hypothetical protein
VLLSISTRIWSMRPLIALFALAADDGGVVFGDDDFLGAAQVRDGGAFQLAAGLFGDHGAAGQDGDVLQHGLAAVAKAGGLDGEHVQHAAQLVQHQGGQGFAVDVLGDDDQLALADLDQLLEQGTMSAQRRSSCRRSGCRLARSGFHVLGSVMK